MVEKRTSKIKAGPLPKSLEGKKGRSEEVGPIEILENAVHLLRNAPIGVISLYYIGALPFILGLLYFWSDMSRSALAYRHVEAAALGMTLLFIWMKTWQAIFARQLNILIQEREFPPLGVKAIFHMIAVQSVIHGAGLFLLIGSILPAMVPFPWTYAFFQNATQEAGSEKDGLRAVYQRARDQSGLWPLGNHILLFILFLFGFFVFLNIAAAILFIPQLLHSLFGVESLATMSGRAAFNTTFVSISVALTYLCIDPLIKAAYAYRCFYGRSLRSGEDIRVELAPFRKKAKAMAAAAVFILIAGFLGAESAQATTTPDSTKGAVAMTEGNRIEPRDLEQAFKDVLSKRKYAWRMPRERSREQETEPGVISGFMDWLTDQFQAAARSIFRFFRKIGRWIDSLSPNAKPDRIDRGPNVDWTARINIIIYVVLAILVLSLTILIWRTLKNRPKVEVATAAETPIAVPDIEDESVSADQLPEAEWLKMAGKLLEQGEPRLAIRALYLAALARLAEAGLIQIAIYKSNREYASELHRRLRDRPNAIDIFSRASAFFDHVWYGRYEANRTDVERFAEEQAELAGEVSTGE